MTIRSWVWGVVAVLGTEVPSWAGTLNVPAQYPTIQAGIDAAEVGDSVLVAQGIYADYQTRIVNGFQKTACVFVKNGVVIKSELGPSVTTIDMADISGPQIRGIDAEDLPSTDTLIDGFTVEGRQLALGFYIRGCGDMKVKNCIFQNFDGGPTTGGAVIAIGNSSLIDSEFLHCTANAGGAIWSTGGHFNLIGCMIRECANTPVFVDETGGVTVSGTIRHCQVIDNTSSGGAGGILIATAQGEVVVTSCLFKGNVNTGSGAGGLALGTGPKTVEDCIFIENGAMGPNGQGGGLSIGGTISIVRGSTFFANYKTENSAAGSAIRFRIPGTFENNIVVGSHGGAAVDEIGGLETSCNVYWDNPQGIGVPLSQTDREIDPLFCDPAIYDLMLRSGSVCLPDDPLGCGLIGALGQGCGPISVDSKSWGAIKALYR
jgi:hypothetical protein